MTLRRSLFAGVLALATFLGGIGLLGRSEVSAASNLTLTPVADTYVNQSTASTAYGSAAQLVADGSPTSRTFIRFNLSSVSGTIVSATLRLHVTDSSNGPSPAGGTLATTTNTTWSEASTTWNSRPTINGASLGSLGAVTRNTWVQRDVKAAVNPGAIVSFALTSTNTDGAYYDSRERGALAPQLVLVIEAPTTPTVTPTMSPSPTPSPTPSPSPTPPPAGPVTLLAVADAFVDASTPSTAYGTTTQVVVDADPNREMLLRFDLSALSGPVQNARLRLHVANVSSGGSPAGGSVSRVNDVAWSEAGVTYATRPTSWGTAVGAFGTVAQNAWVETDVTAAVATGGLLTLGVRSTNTDGAYYDSREVSANAPRLIVTLGTPPAPVTGIVVAAVGDAVCAPGSAVTSTSCRHKAVSDLIANDSSIAHVLMLGDLQYQSGQLSYFQTAYEESYGRFKAKTKPAPGNHEYETAGAAGYYAYFGALAGDPTKGYYSFDVGTKWHLIALNSNCGVVSCAAGSAQEQWLRADLAASSRPCTIAYWHHPRFSSSSGHGDNTNVGPFWTALQQYGAELALAGHDHVYERFAPQLPTGVGSATGITEFVVGTGGHSRSSFATPKANSLVRTVAFGVLRLTLGDGVYAWQMVAENGGTIDSGTGTCH